MRAFEWLGGVPRECVYDNLRAVVARRDGDEVIWNRRFLHLRGHYGFHATPCTPATPREKGSVEAAVRYLKTGFWPARRFGELHELDGQYADWRDRICNRRTHATGRFVVEERLAEERQALRLLPPLRFDWSGHRTSRVPIDGYLRHGGCFYRAPERLVHERVELGFDRDQVWILHRGAEVARYPRSYEQGIWLPPPIMRAEPPAVPPPARAAAADGVAARAQPSAERPLVLHLAQLAWIEERGNVCFLAPPGTGKSHLAIALGLKACERGHRVAFATAQEWVSGLEQAQDRNQLAGELRRLERYHLLVVDEVGYLPLERQAANLLFALVSRQYERGSIIVTSNRGFEQWGEILGDAMVAAALIDRLVHHATMITLKGKSYRLRERGLDVAPATQAPSLRDSA